MAQTKMKKKGANTSLVFTNKMYFFLIPALAFFLIFWIYPVLPSFFLLQCNKLQTVSILMLISLE